MTSRAIAFIAVTLLSVGPVWAGGGGEQQRSLDTMTDVLDCVFSLGDRTDPSPDPNVLWFVRGNCTRQPRSMSAVTSRSNDAIARSTRCQSR